jgi:hypothetical protein|tara:strand:- start:813 stop:953 length:141 start_codon:yes stop_codon:yes gene_type:complete
MPFLFRPVRLVMLLGAAFVAGMLYEHDRQAQNCLEKADLLADAVCQ